jgi:dienelactone hydrolase
LERQRARGAPLDIVVFENATHAFEDEHAEDPRVRYNPAATAREHAMLADLIKSLSEPTPPSR